MCVCVCVCLTDCECLSVHTGSVEERQKLYEEAWVKYPKGLVPLRLPLTFLTGTWKFHSFTVFPQV